MLYPEKLIVQTEAVDAKFFLHDHINTDLTSHPSSTKYLQGSSRSLVLKLQ